jgi:hypothetical protein
VENLCEEKESDREREASSQAVVPTYTNTQMFISEFFTPSLFNRGMLLWHSVGTGKTCTAILTASKSFEQANYTIIWVSRSTLINDVWKNMFGYKPNPVCNVNVRALMETMPLPAELSKQKRMLSKSWIIPPLSYKQFTNLVSKKNRFYKMLEKINGTKDPLRKTLIIIDEAHKLYGESDLLTTEQPNMQQLHASLMNSYNVSRANSAKLLLMTATPITKDPMEMIKLLNLCRPIDDQFPDHYYAFKDRYLDNEGNFINKRDFLNKINGYVSYLDRSNDIRQFSQPKIHYITDEIDPEIVDADSRGITRLNKLNKSQVDSLNKENKRQEIIFNKVSKKMRAHYKSNIIKKYKTHKITDITNKKIKKLASAEIKKVIKTNAKEIDNITKNLKQRFKKVKTRKLIKGDKGTMKASKRIVSQTPYYNLLYKCGKNIASNDLQDYYANEPRLQELTQRNEAYKERINELTNEMKIHKQIRANQMKQLKISVKNGIEPPVSKNEIDDSFSAAKHNYKHNVATNKVNIKRNTRRMSTYKKQLLVQLRKSVSKKKKQSNKDYRTMIKELRKQNMELNEEAFEIMREHEHKLKTDIENVIETHLEEAREQDELEERAKREKLEEKERAKREKLEEKERAKREKLEEKERAKRDKQDEKERAKREKLEEKERAKREKLAEKERAKREKLEEKERAKSAKTKKIKGGSRRQRLTRRRY